MSNNLWDEDSNEQFLDIPDETKLDQHNRPLQSPPAQVQNNQLPKPSNNLIQAAKIAAAQEQEEYDVDSVLEDFSEEEDFTEVLNDANLRIEQGRLYQMIMNHNLFEGMDADPRATQNVEKEIRRFARERMEIMLGMRSEQHVQSAMVSSPFNDLEVDILKKLASKATNGATETAEANEVASVLRSPPKRQTLNPSGGTTALKRSNPQPKPQQKLPTKTQAPLKRTKLNATIEQIAAEEGVPVEALELNYTGIGKPIDQLSPEELAKRQKESAQRLAKYTTVKSSSALPMASPEQQEMLVLQRTTQMAQAPGMAAIIAAAKNMPIKNP
jgi:hypothetical protein